MIGDYARLALTGLRHSTLRSWLTIIGIIIGIAAVVSFLTLNESIIKGVEEQFEMLGVSDIRITPAELTGPPNENRVFDAAIVSELERISIVDYVYPITFNSAEIAFRNETVFFTVLGVNTDAGSRRLADTNIQVDEGRFLEQENSRTVVVGSLVANDTFDREIKVGGTLLINEQPFRVVGVLGASDTDIDRQILIPLGTAETLFARSDTYNLAVVRLRSGLEVEEEADKIEQRLLRKFEDDEFDVFTPQDILDTIADFFAIINIVLSGIAAISIVVAAVGIMNTMFTSVLERTSQIGILKAVGATNSAIISIFMIEAGLLGLSGGILGVVLGFGLAYGAISIVSSLGFLPVSLAISPTVIVIGLGLAVGVGLLSGLAPAIRAARMNLIEALRYE